MGHLLQATHDIINYFYNATLSCAEFLTTIWALKISLKNAFYNANNIYI